MMNALLKTVLVAALALPASAYAAEPPPSASCFEIRYSPEFLDKFPKAPALCQEVVEKDGVKYARMTAEIFAKSGKTVTLGYKNVFGTNIMKLDVEPQPGSTITLNGERVPWAKVKKGDLVTFWLPERSMKIVSQPGDGVSSPIIFHSK